jgi:hypothetical protein
MNVNYRSMVGCCQIISIYCFFLLSNLHVHSSDGEVEYNVKAQGMSSKTIAPIIRHDVQ